MTWLRIAFVDAITHVAPSSLVSSLVVEMAERGHPVENYETKYGREYAAKFGGNPAPVSKWAFDCGGMRHTDTPFETIDVDGLAVNIDCDAFPYVLRAVEDAKIRRFSDGAWYYKLKFWIHATVITVEQHDAIERAMQARVELANSRALAFSEALKRGRAGVS